MANISQQVENKELHTQAEQRAREYIDNFAESLLLQGKTLAAIQEAEVVLTSHIDDARDIIIRERRSGHGRELMLIIGSALFGTFLQGFFTELTAGRKPMVVLYTFMGIAGLLTVFSGLRK